MPTVGCRCWFWIIFLFLATTTQLLAADWQPVKGRLMTRWAKEVSPDNVHPEYPRPQMVRTDWLNLNGLWEYAIRAKDAPPPVDYDGKILVPFPIESALSGVMKPVGPERRLWYRRKVDVPTSWQGKRVLLHIGACDWETRIRVNGKLVGEHRGGYDPFTFDITNALRPSGLQEFVLSVWDPTDAGYQPRGKQVRKPHGIWYTSVTGIWRTIWLEPVPQTSIRRFVVVPDVDRSEVRLKVEIAGKGTGYTIEASFWKPNEAEKGRPASTVTARLGTGPDTDGKTGVALKASLPWAADWLWSPESPHLIPFTLSLLDGNGRKVDSVQSYVGMRKISLGKDEQGVVRLFLNNRPLFHFGPLDQGYWPDGLYTSPTDAALRYDIEITKKLGFNMARKHVKVEPDRWYYWCDRLGLLVWQDMPSGDRFTSRNGPDIERSPESARQFKRELQRVIDSLRNHPCIVTWVPFNEGWGQSDTAHITQWIKEYDPTRLVDSASGWVDRGVGDVHDIHAYPGPAAPPNEDRRAAVLGEFGGLGLPLAGHTWQDKKNWGYRSFSNRESLTAAYLRLIDRLRPLKRAGLAAAVYTQTTDVEIEVNGLMTYDRAVIKMPVDKIAKANRTMYGD